MSARGDRVAGLLAGRELDCLLVTDLFNVRWLTGFTGTQRRLPGQRRGARVLHRLPLHRPGRRAGAGLRARGAGSRDARRPGRAAARPQRLRGRADERAHARQAERQGRRGRGAGGRRRARGGPARREGPRGGGGDARRRADRRRRLPGPARARAGRPNRARGGALGWRASWRIRAPRSRRSRRSWPRPRRRAAPRRAARRGDPGRHARGGRHGARVDGYCSDCTRTFATGPLADEALEVYELVRRAQAGGARRGARRARRAARWTPWRATIIEEAGHGEHFGHGLGHGVGLEVHEAPRAGPHRRGLARGRATL